MASRRSFLVSILGSAALSVLKKTPEPHAAAARPPNFVIFLADDLGYGDLSCYGNRNFTTPQLDRMAAEGTRLTEFYAMPTCTPARASLLTGRYPIRSGMVRVLLPREHFGVPSTEITLAEALKPRAYRTACIGKWHLGDLPQYRPNRHGFDFFYGLLYSNDMTVAFDLPRLRLYRNNQVIESPVDQSTLTKRYTEQAMQFIKENREHPFLLYLPYTMPHVPISASEQFRGKSHYSPYGDAVQEIDWSVGQVLDCLKDNALEENTLTIFTSDNGPKLNTRFPAGSSGILRGGKSTSWEGGVRVPCILRWPTRVPANQVRPGISCLMDLFTSCVELSDVKLPDDRPIDGKDLVPFLQDPSLVVHSEFYYYFGVHLCAVRAEQWKLHFMKREYGQNRKPGPLVNCVPEELYNLANDPGESREVAKEHPDIVEALRGMASDFQALIKAGKAPGPYFLSLLPRLHKSRMSPKNQ